MSIEFYIWQIKVPNLKYCLYMFFTMLTILYNASTDNSASTKTVPFQYVAVFQI
jgi:hypothetical protein